MTPEFFYEVWSAMKSYVPAKERDDAAYQLVTLYDEYFEIEELKHVEESDKHLDHAISEFLEDE